MGRGGACLLHCLGYRNGQEEGRQRSQEGGEWVSAGDCHPQPIGLALLRFSSAKINWTFV